VVEVLVVGPCVLVKFDETQPNNLLQQSAHAIDGFTDDTGSSHETAAERGRSTAQSRSR
jgi:hypothetical protein